MRDYVETFRSQLHKHGIKGKELATSAGRSPNNISEVLNRKVAPSIESFNELIEAADRLSPGFADDYYLALAGRTDISTFVRSLNYLELSTLLILAGQRLGELLPSKTKTAA